MVTCCFFFDGYATHRDLHSFLHDALPISSCRVPGGLAAVRAPLQGAGTPVRPPTCHSASRRRPAAGCERASKDRKSTRLNSSHANISYAVFCLKKKKTTTQTTNDNYTPQL